MHVPKDSCSRLVWKGPGQSENEDRLFGLSVWRLLFWASLHASWLGTNRQTFCAVVSALNKVIGRRTMTLTKTCTCWYTWHTWWGFLSDLLHTDSQLRLLNEKSSLYFSRNGDLSSHLASRAKLQYTACVTTSQ